MKKRDKKDAKGPEETKKGGSRRNFLRQTGTAMLVTNSYMVMSVLTGHKAKAAMSRSACKSAILMDCTSGATVVQPDPCSSCTSCTSSCTGCTKVCISGCCISCTQSTQ